jgi:hypothetical protein
MYFIILCSDLCIFPSYFMCDAQILYNAYIYNAFTNVYKL